MSTQAAIGDDAQGAVKAYEALRHHVLAGAHSANNAGDAALMVLLRQGVAGWMTRRLAYAGPAAAARGSTVIAGQEIHAGIVRVLASMALAAQQEVCA